MKDEYISLRIKCGENEVYEGVILDQEWNDHLKNERLYLPVTRDPYSSEWPTQFVPVKRIKVIDVFYNERFYNENETT